jgi:hypothetical protein
MADYEKEKKKIKKKTKKLGLFSAGPSPIRIGAIAMENRRRKKQRQKELAALPMKVDDFKFDHELRKTKQSVGMKDPQTKTMKFDKVKKKSAGGSMQSYIDKAKKELGDFKSTGSKSTLSKPKSETFRDQGEDYKPKRKKVSMGKITAMNKGGSLKEVPADNKGLGKLPQPVRNKMGYMKKGGVVKMRGGGAATRGMNFNRGY